MRMFWSSHAAGASAVYSMFTGSKVIIADDSSVEFDAALAKQALRSAPPGKWEVMRMQTADSMMGAARTTFVLEHGI
jgi:Tfp pilus assembly protein PilV